MYNSTWINVKLSIKKLFLEKYEWSNLTQNNLDRLIAMKGTVQLCKLPQRKSLYPESFIDSMPYKLF